MILQIALLSGGGNSNTGNVARKAFQNPKEFAEITGFSEHLIKEFEECVCALVSGKDLSSEAYQIKAQKWLEIFHADENLNWCWLSPTVHEILVHGHEIIEALPFAPGLSSEEAIEHGNKVFKHFIKR